MHACQSFLFFLIFLCFFWPKIGPKSGFLPYLPRFGPNFLFFRPKWAEIWEVLFFRLSHGIDKCVSSGISSFISRRIYRVFFSWKCIVTTTVHFHFSTNLNVRPLYSHTPFCPWDTMLLRRPPISRGIVNTYFAHRCLITAYARLARPQNRPELETAFLWTKKS